MQGIDFPKTDSGFAVGWTGRILKSTDSGVTWSPQTSGTSVDLFNVHFASDGLTGIVVGQGGTILRTTNGGAPGEIILSASGYWVRGFQTVDLSWTGATSANVDIYRDGVVRATVPNSGSYTDSTGNRRGNVRYTYKVCEAGASNCSNEVTVRFGGPPL
jgi:hypothetical protein